MNSISEIFNNDNHISEIIETFLKKYIGCSLLQKRNITKMVDVVNKAADFDYCDNPILMLIGDVKNSPVLEKAVSAKELLMDKIAMCFHSASPYRMFKEGTFFNGYKKDTFYRFDRLPKANWERLQLETAKPDEPVDLRTVRGKRRKLAKTKGTEVVQYMVEKAQAVAIPFDYVLFDTWFSNPAQLIALKGVGANVIAMIKKGSTKYTYQDPDTGEKLKLNVKEIYSRNKKRRGRSKYLLSINVTIADKEGNTIPAKLVFARNHSNRKDWVCFVCTDMEADEEKILRVYTLRWKCELYFGICKGYLKLRAECHSTSYDAITSHMVIVAIRYMILAVERFNNTDDRTIEEFFYDLKREVFNEMLDYALTLILDIMLESIRKTFNASDDQMDTLILDFVSSLPDQWRAKFSLPKAT